MIRATFNVIPCADPESAVAGMISEKLGRNIQVAGYEIRRRSLDCRRGKNVFVYTVDIVTANRADEPEAALLLGAAAVKKEEEYVFPTPARLPEKRPVIAGFGPAGMFAALCLARAGLKPLIIERGKPAGERVRDVDAFFSGGKLDPDSNIQYGEGGAGAFSDGKLNTLVKDKSFRGGFVLRELVKAGAPKEILYYSHPHVGTDILRGVIGNIRGEILSLGGEILFGTKLEDVIVDPLSKLKSVVTGKGAIDTDALFLATGQSAREVAELLFRRGAEIGRKPFSVGFRIEHPQSMINAAQYGKNGDMRFLPPAEYKLFSHTPYGRTVYSFCMCPGGSVVAAASEEQRLVTNGMSLHARDGENANSAILCEVLPEDLGDGLFAGYDYREKLERAAFRLGKGGFKAPAAALGSLYGENARIAVKPTYPLGTEICDIFGIFNREMIESFRYAFKEFGKKVDGFDFPGALLTAVESRTSSPVRIIRFADRQSNLKGVYPLGEGAGYAGGIMSAAIDGIRSAEEYVLNL